jgi:hypothetical protein
MDTTGKNYWNTVYETKSPGQVSWTQEVPQTSLNEDLTTPFDTRQNFLFCSFKKSNTV